MRHVSARTVRSLLPRSRIMKNKPDPRLPTIVSNNRITTILTIMRMRDAAARLRVDQYIAVEL